MIIKDNRTIELINIEDLGIYAVRVFKNGVEQSTNIVDKETYERIKENDTN